MKAVLHIGMPKNGSTSIQTNLTRHQKKLASYGVIMPLLNGKRYIHPHHLKNLLYSRDMERKAAARPKAGEAFETILAVVAEKPDCVFMSSEDIAQGYRHISILKANLMRWFDQIKPIVYIRDHTSLYRSHIQHHVKSQYYVPSPSEWKSDYLEVIRHFHREFPDSFEIIKFERSTLFRGSVVNDAVTRCGVDIPADESFDTEKVNESSIAEVSVVMQQYMQEHQPDQKRYDRQNISLRLFLERFAIQHDLGSKCILKDEVAETILALNRSELFELRDRWNVAFDDVDYDGLDGMRAHQPCLHLNKIEDLCHIDSDVVAALKDLMNQRLAQQAG